LPRFGSNVTFLEFYDILQKVDGVLHFSQQSPIIIGFPMQSFGAHDRPSSYEVGDLPGQGCNRCCSSKRSEPAHLSTTSGGLILS